MKFPRSTNLLKLAWLASFSLPTAHAQSTGGSNLPTQLITYRLTEIIADPTSAITLPIALSTSLIGNSPTPGDPVASPQDTDIQWSGSTGEPLFTPSSGGSSVKLDFTQPFVKTLSDAATTITATYTFGSGPSSGSGSDPSLPPPTVYPSSQTKNLDRIYLDFWVANTEDATDDVVLVRTTDSELASGEKTVLHWAKVTVKHSRGQSLKLKIENATSSGKSLYFLDQEENPNTQTQDPQLSNKLEKEFDDGKFFWVGSAEKGAGVGKFKAQGDLGSGYKDAPEEKTVNLLPVEVEKISFDGTNYYELKKDDLSETYSAPHWIKADGTNESVAFKRKSKPKVEAFFKLNVPDDLLAKIKIKGMASDGVEFPEQTPMKDGGSVKYSMKEAATAFPDTIKFYDRDDDAKAFKIDWQISVDGGVFSSIGESKHQVYLTLNDPVTALRQETLFNLSAKNADGDNVEADARNSMYGEFTDLVVKRLDGKQMTYWKDQNTAFNFTEASEILANPEGDGNCQAWSGLFREVLQIQGIQADRIRVWPQTNDRSVAVKNWTFSGTGQSGNATYPYTVGVDVNPGTRIPAQGNKDSPEYFNGHWITESGGAYYDPSYGAAAVSGTKKGKIYEDGAFDGFGDALPPSKIRKNDSSAQSPSQVDYFNAN